MLDANPALLEMFGYKKTEIMAIKSSYLFLESDDKIKFDTEDIEIWMHEKPGTKV